jgi:hypothetical protein
MTRSIVGAAVLGIMLAHAGGVDVSACGDKFLLVGRSLRYRAMFASKHPSSILAYAVPGSRMSKLMGDGGFGALLAFAGHKVRVVDGPDALDQMLRATPYDLVLSDARDVAILQLRLAALGQRPAFVPVVFDASKADVTVVQHEYGSIVRVPSRGVEALAAVEEAIKLRSTRLAN